MRRILIPLLALVASSALLAPANGATARAVDVIDSAFDPSALQADAGDPIEWTWRGSTTHNVTAFSGDTFSSGNRGPGTTFSTVFAGGAVQYRCTLHSTLDNGRCLGMCGVIAEDASPPTAPAISEPADGATVRSPVRISGSAPGADRVVISENGVQRAFVPVGPGGAWSTQISMSDGAHTISAVARNLLGIEGPATARAFTVDATPPTVTLTSPTDLSPGSSPLLVTGEAADERSLASVTVRATNAITGAPVATVVLPHAGGAWETTMTLEPGLYAVTATAADAAGNTRATSPARVIIL